MERWKTRRRRDAGRGLSIRAALPRRALRKRARLSPPQYALESLLGPTGHLERFSAWAHGWAVGFGVYAIVRHSLDEAQMIGDDRELVGDGRRLVVGGHLAASSIYHCTTPSKRFATVTRQLDYLAIYLSIVFGGVSDLAVVTEGFDAVPWLTIVDVPAAVLVGASSSSEGSFSTKTRRGSPRR